MVVKCYSIEYFCEYVYFCLCINVIGVVICVCNCLLQVIYCFFYEKGYFWIFMFILMVSDIEGVGEMFCVLIFDMMNFLCDDKGNVDYLEDFFGKEIYLMVLGQFNVEIYCIVMFKVYIFGFMFCVENLNMFCYFVEFWMIEFEVVFVELKDVV